MSTAPPNLRVLTDDEKEKLSEWFNSTPHDMGKNDFGDLCGVVARIVGERVSMYASANRNLADHAGRVRAAARKETYDGMVATQTKLKRIHKALGKLITLKDD